MLNVNQCARIGKWLECSNNQEWQKQTKQYTKYDITAINIATAMNDFKERCAIRCLQEQGMSEKESKRIFGKTYKNKQHTRGEVVNALLQTDESFILFYDQSMLMGKITAKAHLYHCEGSIMKPKYTMQLINGHAKTVTDTGMQTKAICKAEVMDVSKMLITLNYNLGRQTNLKEENEQIDENITKRLKQKDQRWLKMMDAIHGNAARVC
jgi:hypothetical protein